MENTKAKEEQSALKSPPDCSLLVDAHGFQVDMYTPFWGFHGFYLSFELSEKRFQHLDLKNSKWSLLKGHARKRDILFSQ